MPSKTMKTEADPEEPSSGLDSPTECHESNRLTSQDSKARRLAKFDPRQMSMGDCPSESSGTPFYLGSISKSWSETGKMLEEKGIPDTGCTQDVIPIAIAKEHGLKIRKPDSDEPGMQAFGETRVDIIGQVSSTINQENSKRRNL